MAGQVQGGDEAGAGDYVFEDGTAKIVTGGRSVRATRSFKMLCSVFGVRLWSRLLRFP